MNDGIRFSYIRQKLITQALPLLAPLTKPAMSTISTVVGITRCGFTNLSNSVNRLSGTVITPTLGSMVQKGKFADCALALDKQLKRVDFPTLGSPTIPHFRAITFQISTNITPSTKLFIKILTIVFLGIQ